MAIHDQMVNGDNVAEVASLPDQAWQQCDQLVRKIRIANRKGWGLAVNRLRRDLHCALDGLQSPLADVRRRLVPPPTKQHKVSAQDILADLKALHDEFDDVRCDRRGRTVSVTTEPITLEGVYLGPFEICLDWDDLASCEPDNYRVIALDSNPAASDDSVTHPHVQYDVLCAGDGGQPIRQALGQGRLLDFFLIVANLLRTYNSGSPYVALSEWQGVRCADCGGTTSNDERWICEKCESTVCGECYFTCPGCDCVFCSECLTRCEGCDQLHCNACMKQCSVCGDDRCQGCLDDDERCSDCDEQETEEESEVPVSNEQHTEDGAAGTSVQPHGVGQVAVPA